MSESRPLRRASAGRPATTKVNNRSGADRIERRSVRLRASILAAAASGYGGHPCLARVSEEPDAELRRPAPCLALGLGDWTRPELLRRSSTPAPRTKRHGTCRRARGAGRSGRRASAEGRGASTPSPKTSRIARFRTKLSGEMFRHARLRGTKAAPSLDFFSVPAARIASTPERRATSGLGGTRARFV